MRKGIEKRIPEIGERKIELTPEEELIKRKIEIEKERKMIQEKPEVRVLDKKLKSIEAMKTIAEKKVEAARQELEKRENELDEIRDKKQPFSEEWNSFFKEVDMKRRDWGEERIDFLMETTLKKMGYGPRIEEIKTSILAERIRDIVKLPIDERKSIAKVVNKEAVQRVRNDTPREKLKTYGIEYERAEKDLDEKLKVAKQEGKEK